MNSSRGYALDLQGESTLKEFATKRLGKSVSVFFVVTFPN